MARKRAGWRPVPWLVLTVASLVAAGTLAIVAPALPGVPGSSPAQAFCHGQGDPMSWSVGWAEETVRWNSTCDNLGDYYGKVHDSRTDGYCVRLYSKDDWEYAWVYEGQSCGSWTNFVYTYSDRNAWWQVCKTINGSPQVCSDPAYNWGF